MKRKIIVLLTTFTIMVCGNAKADTVDFYREISDEVGVVEIIDTADLTKDILEDREGKIIIERCIGTVENDNGDGLILNYADPDSCQRL